MTRSGVDLHPTAVVGSTAELGSGVTVGPHAVIADNVVVGDGTTIDAHAVVSPFVRLGKNNHVHPHAVLGGPPQDISFDGRETWVEIGDANQIREAVTVQRSTNPEQPTRVGSGCFLMVNSHVAHDCQMADGVILTNNVALAGHVHVEERVIFGGAVNVHQFVRIGTQAMIGGLSGVHKDVLPYSMVSENPARHFRLNTIGLRRAGIKGDRFRALQSAFRALRAGDDLSGIPDTPEILHLREWLAAPSKRGLTRFFQRG